MNPFNQTVAQLLGIRLPRCSFLLPVLLGLLVCSPVVRGQNQTQFWTEVDAYVNLSPRTRFVFVTELYSQPQAGNLQGEVGPNFDFYLRPFLRPRLRDLDPAKSKLLTFRISYRYFPTLIGDSPPENRPLTELTARFHIPLSILLSDRSREEFRFISGKPFSWRYRNRLTLERNVAIHKYIFTPYARDEFYYTNRQISANAVMIGSIFTTTKHTELELYYKDARVTTTTPNSDIHGAGLTFRLYF